MEPLVLLTTAFVAGSLAAAWYRSAGDWQSRQERLRKLGWGAALTAVTLNWSGLYGSNHWPALIGLPAAALVMVFAPKAARRLLPWALLALGLYGFVLAGQYAYGRTSQVLYGLVLAGAGSWRTQLVLVQAYVFLAAGAWLLWRAADGRSPLARLVPGPPPSAALDGAKRAGRGLLLVPAAVLASQLIASNWWPDGSWLDIPWIVAAALLALTVAMRAPRLAADLAVVSLICTGLYGWLIMHWRRLPGRQSATA